MLEDILLRIASHRKKQLLHGSTNMRYLESTNS